MLLSHQRRKSGSGVYDSLHKACMSRASYVNNSILQVLAKMVTCKQAYTLCVGVTSAVDSSSWAIKMLKMLYGT